MIEAPIRSTVDATAAATEGVRAVWGVAGAVLWTAAAIVIVTVPPQIGGDGAARAISEFYADAGRRNALLVAEPLALAATVCFAWFAGRLNALLAAVAPRQAALAHGGALLFAALAFTSVAAGTTVAGTLAFTDAFRADPQTAMVLSHLAYVLMAGAMMGAAVMAAATATALRHSGAGGPWLVRTGYAVAALALVALPFVYLPLVAFQGWLIALALRLRRARVAA